MKITIHNYEKDLPLFENLLPDNIKEAGVPFLNKFLKLYGKKAEIDAGIDYILDAINEIVEKHDFESNATSEDYEIPQLNFNTDNYMKFLLYLAAKVEEDKEFKIIKKQEPKERTKIYYTIFDRVLKAAKDEQPSVYWDVINNDKANEWVYDYQLRQYVHEYFERQGLCIRKIPTIGKKYDDREYKPVVEILKECASEKGKTSKKEKKTKSSTKKKTNDKQEITEEPTELYFIKKFTGWQGKVKTKTQVYNFIRQLQNAIVQKKVRASSEFAPLIVNMQSFLVELFDNFRSGTKTIQIPETFFSKYKEIANYKWADHILIIKKYISILSETKTGLEEKAKALLKKIEKSSFDPKVEEAINDIKKSLKYYLSGKTARPQLHIYSLQGLMGLAGISELGNIENPDLSPGNTPVYSSMAIKDKKFDLLNLYGKWENLLGHVSVPFKLMFWGGGGSGKTTLALDFAGFLAKNLNKKCLFVPNEEKTGHTFVEKLNRTQASSPNLDISDELPTNLSVYDVIFLDSITTMNIGLETMIRLTGQYPKISWVWLFQTTKEGAFRGDQNWQHLVDAEIYCSNGKARTLKNRFGGKEQINIY